MKFRFDDNSFDSDMSSARIDLWKSNCVNFSGYSALNSLLSLGFYPSGSLCNNNEVRGDLTSASQCLMQPYSNGGDRPLAGPVVIRQRVRVLN